MNLTTKERLLNKTYFLRTLKTIKENGYYLWKDEGEVFQKINGKFHGTNRGLLLISNITNKKFTELYFRLKYTL